jgi:hypothetical protein
LLIYFLEMLSYEGAVTPEVDGETPSSSVMLMDSSVIELDDLNSHEIMVWV